MLADVRPGCLGRGSPGYSVCVATFTISEQRAGYGALVDAC